MDPENFNLTILINQMKELRRLQLGDQVKEALENAKLGFDAESLAELVGDLEEEIEEQIERLERIAEVMTTEEKAGPELLDEMRRREVAFQSGCDIEDVESLCEAFSKAREILAGLRANGGGVLDVKLLFGQLPGLDFGSDPEQIMRALTSGKAGRARGPEDRPSGLDEVLVRPSDMEGQFDLSRTHTPKNRLPKGT